MDCTSGFGDGMRMGPGFDAYGKLGLTALLSEFGTTTVAKKVLVAPHEVDVYFEPGRRVSEAPGFLGLLGELLQQPTLLEPFSTAPGLERLSGCVLKLHSVWTELRRATRRQSRKARRSPEEPRQRLRPPPERWRPRMVVFVPTASPGLVRAVCPSSGRAIRNTSKPSLPGLYYSSSLYRTFLVVCDRLPLGERTLFIRLLFGRGETLVTAWREFHALLAGTPLYTQLVRQARSYSIYLEGLGHLKPDQERQLKEYRMVWCLFDRDLVGEREEALQNKILEQARMLESVRSEYAASSERLLAEQEARLRAEQEARLRAEQEARLRAEQEARLRAEQEARLRAEQERRILLEQLLLERFPERTAQYALVLDHLLRLSAPLAIRCVLQQSWDALCRNAALEVVQ